ncbi:sodium-coupled monocarboxylate transporter 1-like [Mercenaria mercenaria]|uniref:sodium-coupled monocarboxylate transporter 1-like n=1 Tax=Mercenaria mercenaria TaxID=6596 RepID=UPI00234E7373|nr:sodium-coupled monocarboxylate transporter 1-like [Mercenaria mercenaria]
MERLKFHTVDYVVMVIFLAISSAIGIYYGFYKKQRTTEEYILGNRQSHLVPVALSLAVTFQSATSIIGLPSEIYLYNIMVFYITFGISIANLIQALVIVPLVHPLRLTSAYEYLQRRFQSRAVQLLGMSMACCRRYYMSALSCILQLWHLKQGGMRTVIWTDIFQFVMLYGGLTVILILGVKEIGSLRTVFALSLEGDRMKFDEYISMQFCNIIGQHCITLL